MQRSAPHRFAPVRAVAAGSAIALGLGLLALSGCSRPEAAPEPIRAVKVMEVAPSGLQLAHEYAAEVRARVESRLGFRVGGKLTRRHVELGQRVAAGQLLAELDPQDLRLAADAARAQVAAAQTNRDLAAADFKRFQALREQNFISAAELERRDTTLKAAQAQLEQAQAQLSAQSNQAGYTQLRADAAGVITALEADPGQVVAAGAPVVRLAQDGPRDVVFAVPEDKVAALRVGSPVAVRPWAGGEALQGPVRDVAASADPVTRTFTVKVALPAKAMLPLGSTVTVMPAALSAGGVPSLKLPTSALRQEGGRSTVWLLDRASMTVKPQPVVVATADGNEAVITEGLQPGMVVVTAGVHVLAPGQKVTIYQAPGSAVSASNPPAVGAPPQSGASKTVAAPAAGASAARGQ